MTGGVTREVLQGVFLRVCDRLEACSAELNDRDAKLGDGDLGSTLASIAGALRSRARTLPEDVGEALGQAVAAIAATSGSSFSAVAMTGLHRAATAAAGRTSVPWHELPGLLVLAQEAMGERGGARPGDKSVLDGIAAIARAIDSEPNPAGYVAAADAALAETLVEFRSRPCRIGRARLSALSGVGQDDPGMVALKRIVEAIAEAQTGGP